MLFLPMHAPILSSSPACLLAASRCAQRILFCIELSLALPHSTQKLFWTIKYLHLAHPAFDLLSAVPILIQAVITVLRALLRVAIVSFTHSRIM